MSDYCTYCGNKMDYYYMCPECEEEIKLKLRIKQLENELIKMDKLVSKIKSILSIK